MLKYIFNHIKNTQVIKNYCLGCNMEIPISFRYCYDCNSRTLDHLFFNIDKVNDIPLATQGFIKTENVKYECSWCNTKYNHIENDRCPYCGGN